MRVFPIMISNSNLDKQRDWFKILATGFISAILLFMFGIYPVSYKLSKDSTVITVKDKYVKLDNEQSRYLVVSTNNEVFENTDSLVLWKFNSSDLFAKMDIGKTYAIEKAGWRVHALSSYENILTATEIKPDSK